MDKKYILSLFMVPFLFGGAHTADASRSQLVSVYHNTHGGFFRLLTISSHAVAVHISRGGFLPYSGGLANGLLD